MKIFVGVEPLGAKNKRDQRVEYFQTRPGSAEDTRGVKARVGARRADEH